MTAYYNEIDPYAAQWLRNLIDNGHIAPGYVDERSIEDVCPDELSEFTQCHFFAGIGVWSIALRRAGWPDDRPVWTGSCPCQPFSTAGKGDGFTDERHLWPAWFHLVTQCRPSAIYGEQVASKDGLGWLDLVQADLEAAGYAVGAVDLCAAGVGAPHLRQRLWFHAQRLGHTDIAGLEGLPGHGGVAERKAPPRPAAARGISSSVANAQCKQCEGSVHESGQSDCAKGCRPSVESTRLCRSSSVANAGRERLQRGEREGPPRKEGVPRGCSPELRGTSATDPTNGLWADADWLLCRDGKFRPVEPGTFPLADGVANRVGRLRAYGNAINAEAARHIIEASM